MKTGMSYIGRKSCGCMVCAIVDDPDMKKDIAKHIAEWISWGLTIERVTHETVRNEFVVDCPHTIRQQKLFEDAS